MKEISLISSACLGSTRVVASQLFQGTEKGKEDMKEKGAVSYHILTLIPICTCWYSRIYNLRPFLFLQTAGPPYVCFGKEAKFELVLASQCCPTVLITLTYLQSA